MGLSGRGLPSPNLSADNWTYTQDTQKIRTRYTQDTHKIDIRYTQDTHKIHRRYSTNPEIISECTASKQEVCII
jgi:hypothetical protein